MTEKLTEKEKRDVVDNILKECQKIHPEEAVICLLHMAICIYWQLQKNGIKPLLDLIEPIYDLYSSISPCETKKTVEKTIKKKNDT